ncbi:MAG: response regulator [Alphaproteobacteria bacterium]|nr:response regulator [Alphaproteobacteria bacterium]NCQ87608.1 response regulator [Alphaproteobacteria bacterium]NCT05883.1 response regulator [Alphaproteobacteria bacterium]
MPFDHSEFIEKYKNPRRPEAADPKERAKSMILGLVFITLYLAGCYFLAGFLGVDKVTMIVAGLAFVIAGIAGYSFQQVLFSYKRREKELKLLREVLEGSRGARLITDSADNAIYANQRFEYLCQPYGPPSIETLAMLFSDNPEVANHFNKLAEQAYRGLTDSMELVSKEGEGERWFLVTAQPVAGWAGFVHWRVDDITEARDLNRSVREEREKLIDFTDNAPVGFFSVNEEGRFVFVNATLARWLGDSIEHLLANGRIHTYLETPPKGVAPYDVLEKGGLRQVAEIKMKGPAGTTFLASINMAVVRESDGRVRTRGVVHDLTSEREMRKALQASEDRFQKFFDEAPVGVMLIGSDGKIKDTNAAMASLVKIDMESLENQNLKDLITGDNAAEAFDAIDKIETGRRMTAPMEVMFKDKGNHNIVTQMHGRRFKNSDDIVLHFIDLTEQKDLELQFVQSQKMQAVGQLAGGIAHDFNNLLTAIIGFSDLLMLRHKPGDPSFGDIMQIKQNSNRAANLVRQLLAFSRQQTLRPKVHDITDILTELSHLIRRLIGANIELEVLHGSDLGLIKVDVGQMEQVLINLAVNARDAMDGGGKLTIKTDNYENKKTVKRCDDDMPPGRWLIISVTDTGTGISPENMSRILEPFFTTKGVGEGTGLGLATVYGIIRQTGGYLDIKTKLGEGTTFSIFLPVLGADEKREEIVEEKKDDTPADLTGTARILLVEDEEAVRAFSTRALVNKGYDVIGADCGESALSVLEKAENKEIDLLITDVMMPNMDGPTLAKKLRDISPHLRIIFISGYSEDKLKEHMGEGISFLPKPFTLKQLAAKVKEALVD